MQGQEAEGGATWGETEPTSEEEPTGKMSIKGSIGECRGGRGEKNFNRYPSRKRNRGPEIIQGKF